ncbi:MULTISPECIES: proton-conducting transporter membrane subunit [Actinomadura]|uniref:Proton-conducting transporter membrane subunit n=1 Tax=Actinomadura yumaensis TaxID=111807 RepID=A0ABW2CAR0_9ACTN|nr:proton-conducting transporter membrane subunit [Actinomadura sp. J1-007]MWK33433.1 NADH-quinone oxidoreductase subunit L [Actinomadura sp. J1-007]
MIWALVATPLLAGGALLLCGRRADRYAPRAGVAVAAAVLALAVAAAAVRPRARFRFLPGWDSGLAVDGLSAAMAVTVAAITLAVLLYAAAGREHERAGVRVGVGDNGGGGEGEVREARFFGLMLVFAGAMLVAVTATDLVLLLMGWEVMGAMSYALIGYWWADGGRVRAAGVAFLTTRAGDLGLYAAAGLAVAGTAVAGTGAAGAGAAGAADGGAGPGAGALLLGGLAGTGEPWRDLVAAGIVVAALGKSAQLPFSFWLSRAMAGPSPVSALLHSATMVAAGAYLLLRLRPLLDATGWAGPLVAWAGALTALLLGAVALAQTDLKQLLAASTCAQIGFMVLGAGTGAVAGGTAHLVAHAAVKSLLFLCAGAWLAVLGTKDLDGLRGAARRHPVVGVAFAAGALALAGLPPLSLWITKDSVLAAARDVSPALYVLGLAASVLSSAYAAKALLAVWRPAPEPAPEPAHKPEPEPGASSGERVGALRVLPLPVLAVAACALGVLGLPGVAGPWRRALGVPGEHGPDASELAVSGVLAAATLAAVVAFAGRRTAPIASAWAFGWLGLERAVDVVVVRPVFGAARVLAAFDDRVVHGCVRGVARAGPWAAGLAARRVEVRVDGLVAAVGRGARRLAVLARRPQTGQVHTYYAQAAVLLAALVLIAVLIG